MLTIFKYFFLTFDFDVKKKMFDDLLVDIKVYLCLFLKETFVLTNVIVLNRRWKTDILTKMKFQQCHHFNIIKHHYKTSTQIPMFTNSLIKSDNEFYAAFQRLPYLSSVSLINCRIPFVFPISLTGLILFIDISNEAEISNLPSTIKDITFNGDLCFRLTPKTFHSSITSLTFNGDVKGEFLTNVFPPSLTYLDFPYFYTYELQPSMFPSSLQTLKLYCFADENVNFENGILPPSLTYLSLRKRYSSMTFPPNITLNFL